MLRRRTIPLLAATALAITTMGGLSARADSLSLGSAGQYCPAGVAAAVAPVGTSIVPRDSNFDWQNTKDPAQLLAHGYPPHPMTAQTAGIENAKQVTGLTFWTCPGVSAGPGPSYRSTTSNWAGNAFETSITGDSYDDSDLSYTVPSVSNDAGQLANLAIWAGVGSGANTTHELVQVGSSQDVTAAGTVTTYPFIEVFPYESIVPVSLALAPGDYIQVQAWTTGPHDAYFEIDASSGSTGVIHTALPSGATITPDSAEWIAERVTVGGALRNLAQWSGAINLSGEGLDSTTNSWLFAGVPPHASIYMNSGSNVLAYPSAWTDPPWYSTFPVYRTANF